MGNCFPMRRSNQNKAIMPYGQSNLYNITAEHTNSYSSSLKKFTLRELTYACGRFRKENMIGRGSFGKVYKGWIDDWTGEMPGQKRAVAIKVLDKESFQGFSEWLAEVLLLGRLQHKNLVRLLGYCTDNDEAILVYEFLENGSLDEWLISDGKKEMLPWATRAKIALGATEGLLYLHSQNIIHRDLKSCNILLDSDFNSRLTDFGLATMGPDEAEGQTHISTRVMGTMGYLDPKYLETGHLTPKSDVYALGVIFLELLSGRPPVDDGNEEERLTVWARPHLYRRPCLEMIMDPRLGNHYNPVGAQKMAILAKHCVSEDPEARPQLQDLVKTLRVIVETSAPGEQPPGSMGQGKEDSYVKANAGVFKDVVPR